MNISQLLNPQVDIDLTVSLEFHADEWIQQNRIAESLPLHVIDAWKKVIAVPHELLHLLPEDQLSVPEILDFNLPPSMPSSIIKHKASAWFSTEPPNEDFAILVTRPLPSHDTVKELVIASKQAFLDGASSVKDLRYKDSRLPLGVVGFWEIVAKVNRAKMNWHKSKSWAKSEREKLDTTATAEKLDEAFAVLECLPWNADVCDQTSASIATSTLGFAALLSVNALLSDTLLDMMVSLVHDRIVAGTDTSVDSSTTNLVAPLEFSNAVVAAASTHGLYKSGNFPTLRKYETIVKQQEIQKMYFVVHLPNHWVSSMINFKEESFCFGETHSCFSGSSIIVLSRAVCEQETHCPVSCRHQPALQTRYRNG